MAVVMKLIPELIGLSVIVFLWVRVWHNTVIYQVKKGGFTWLMAMLTAASLAQAAIALQSYLPAAMVSFAYTVILTAVPLCALGVTMLFNEYLVGYTAANIAAVAVGLTVVIASATGRLFMFNPFVGLIYGPGHPAYVAIVLAGVAGLLIANLVDIMRNASYKRGLLVTLYVLEMSVIGFMAIAPDVFSLWPASAVGLLFYYVYLGDIQFVTDPLTGVLNANAFTRMVMDFQPTSRTGLALVDLNNLRQLNDAAGSRDGDYCLRRISRQLTMAFVDTGYVYRIAGTEFCVICPQIDKDDFHQTLQTCCQGLRDQLSARGMPIELNWQAAMYQARDGRLMMTMKRVGDHLEARHDDRVG